MWRLFIWGFMLFIVLQLTGCEGGSNEYTSLDMIGRGLMDNDEDCVSEAVYFEARGEPEEGQRLVVWSIINRSLKKNWSFCRVVQYPMQYSYRNCINPLTNKPVSAAQWDDTPDKVCPVLSMDDLDSKYQAERITRQVLEEYESTGVANNITHFHAVRLGGARYGGSDETVIGKHLYYSAPDAL